MGEGGAMGNILKEFKAFLMQGNLITLAVAFVIALFAISTNPL